MDIRPNKAKALHLVKQGFQVIPVGVAPDGSNIYNGTSWTKTIIDNETTVNTYWYDSIEDRRVAVVHPTIGVIDVDVKNGKNGFDSLKEAGYELPNTYNYETKSGGRHYLVRFPQGSTKSVPVDGVDIQVANGIFVWYGDVLSDEELANIADAPAWALQGKPEKKTIKADPIAWMNSLPQGEYSSPVERIMDWKELKYPNIDHTAMIKGQFALLSEGAKGAVGVLEALMELKSRYLQGEYDTPEYEKEWNDGLKGIVIERADELDAIAEANTDDARIDALADEMYIKEKARLKAQNRINSEGYVGSDLISWEELFEKNDNWLVEGIIPQQGMGFFIGRSNIGKTFCVVDLACSIAIGQKWLAKKTRQAKVMIVAGEGISTIAERFQAWTEEYGVPFELIKDSVFIVNGGNLSNPVSIQKLQEHIKANNIELVIFDTFSANAPGIKENDAGETSLILHNSKTLGDISVMYVHHPRKSEENSDNPTLRGSGALYGAADYVMSMYKDKEYKPSSGEKMEFLAISTEADHGGKNRNGRNETIQGVYLQENESERVVAKQLASASLSKHDILVRKALRGAMSASTFHTALESSGVKVSKDTARKALQESKLVEVVSAGNGGNIPATYRWTEEGVGI